MLRPVARTRSRQLSESGERAGRNIGEPKRHMTARMRASRSVFPMHFPIHPSVGGANMQTSLELPLSSARATEYTWKKLRPLLQHFSMPGLNIVRSSCRSPSYLMARQAGCSTEPPHDLITLVGAERQGNTVLVQESQLNRRIHHRRPVRAFHYSRAPQAADVLEGNFAQPSEGGAIPDDRGREYYRSAKFVRTLQGAGGHHQHQQSCQSMVRCEEPYSGGYQHDEHGGAPPRSVVNCHGVFLACMPPMVIPSTRTKGAST
jgi:hypothetical protein